MALLDKVPLVKEEKILLPQGPRLQPPLLMLLRRVYLRPIKSLTNPNPRASSAPSSERERERGPLCLQTPSSPTGFDATSMQATLYYDVRTFHLPISVVAAAAAHDHDDDLLLMMIMMVRFHVSNGWERVRGPL